MSYHSLKVYGYSHHSPKLVKNEYHRRLKNSDVIKTNLKLFVDGYNFPLFLMPINPLIKLEIKVEIQSKQINYLNHQLPSKIQKQFFLNNLLKEIRATNAIEGLKTTHNEVKLAIEHALKNEHPLVPLQLFAKMYLRIAKHIKLNLQQPKTIRLIWNKLFKGVMSADKTPQHTLFRDKTVRIGNALETAWQPKLNEKAFLPDIKDWLKFINSHQCLPLTKALVAHFYFEAIHPFFDGNGRTGRYILCTYLSNKLDALTAISFSQVIYHHQNWYYKAFKLLDNPKDFGEVTFFVISMLKIIDYGQTKLIKELNHLK